MLYHRRTALWCGGKGPNRRRGSQWDARFRMKADCSLHVSCAPGRVMMGSKLTRDALDTPSLLLHASEPESDPRLREHVRGRISKRSRYRRSCTSSCFGDRWLEQRSRRHPA